jgi:hypothetical protein
MVDAGGAVDAGGGVDAGGVAGGAGAGESDTLIVCSSGVSAEEVPTWIV